MRNIFLDIVGEDLVNLGLVYSGSVTVGVLKGDAILGLLQPNRLVEDWAAV